MADQGERREETQGAEVSDQQVITERLLYQKYFFGHLFTSQQQRTHQIIRSSDHQIISGLTGR